VIVFHCTWLTPIPSDLVLRECHVHLSGYTSALRRYQSIPRCAIYRSCVQKRFSLRDTHLQLCCSTLTRCHPEESLGPRNTQHRRVPSELEDLVSGDVAMEFDHKVQRPPHRKHHRFPCVRVLPRTVSLVWLYSAQRDALPLDILLVHVSHKAAIGRRAFKNLAYEMHNVAEAHLVPRTSVLSFLARNLLWYGGHPARAWARRRMIIRVFITIKRVAKTHLSRTDAPPFPSPPQLGKADLQPLRSCCSSGNVT
jgi:hypothetical protein